LNDFTLIVNFKYKGEQIKRYIQKHFPIDLREDKNVVVQKNVVLEERILEVQLKL
jgi:hypothetical protein